MKNKRFLVVAMLSVLGLSAIGLIFKPTILFASSDAKSVINVAELNPSPELRERMAAVDENFTVLEKTLNRIAESKVVTAEDDQTLDSAGMGVADTLKDAFDSASRATLDAAESEGRKGNEDDLAFFESFEEAHIKRADAIASKSIEIEKGISDGTITDRTKANVGANVATVNYVKEDKSKSCSTDAEMTKVLKPCIAPCVGKRWYECAQCILKNVPAGIEHWNSFVNCWNGCHGFWKWACRLVCLAKFVYWVY